MFSTSRGWCAASGAFDRLVAQRFDYRGGKVTGKPVVLGDAPILGGNNETWAVSVSRAGILTYPAGRLSDTQLACLDRLGRVEHPFSLPAGRWEEVSIWPDGRRALVSRRGMSEMRNLWLVDLTTGQATLSNAKPSSYFQVIWSPDGKRVAYSALRPKARPISSSKPWMAASLRSRE